MRLALTLPSVEGYKLPINPPKALAVPPEVQSRCGNVQEREEEHQTKHRKHTTKGTPEAMQWRSLQEWQPQQDARDEPPSQKRGPPSPAYDFLRNLFLHFPVA
jgi:hypothetical protein